MLTLEFGHKFGSRRPEALWRIQLVELRALSRDVAVKMAMLVDKRVELGSDYLTKDQSSNLLLYQLRTFWVLELL